jgi:hypothetical protein
MVWQEGVGRLPHGSRTSLHEISCCEDDGWWGPHTMGEHTTLGQTYSASSSGKMSWRNWAYTSQTESP